MAALLGLLVIVSKLPWVFTTLGEHDHSRLILAAMVYAQDGAQTIRPYSMLTSPLWTLPMSWLSHGMNAPQLVLASNVVGWISGGLTAALAYAVLRQFDCRRLWAATGAVAVTWVPGAFYTSLYGYPSQWALPFMLASAGAFLRCLDSPTRKGQLRWFLVATLAFCVLVLIKVDFALVGTLLVGVAVIRNRLWDRWTLSVPLIALVAGGLVMLVSRLLIEQTYGDFATGWAVSFPGKSSPLADPFSITTLYSVGLGTAILWSASVAAGLVQRTTRAEVGRILLAWMIAVLPLWLFWMSRPPMSSRHALPGAVLTALFAAHAAGRVWGRHPWVAPLWLIALIGVNALLGPPGFDFNYRPSGNLPGGARMNRQAFAVSMRIAEDITARSDRTKAILGSPDSEVLGSIDILSLIEYSMAARSASVRCVGKIGGPTDPHAQDLVFTAPDGHRTNLLRYVDPRRVGLYRGDGVAFYAPWGLQGAVVNVVGVTVVEFDPTALHNEMFHQ